ncbi:MAG: energy-coupling factor transporter transmembrane component T family protein [Promethearchaeia archaeon]
MLPFVILITIFIPFYIGTDVLVQFKLGFTLCLYREGLHRAFLLFMRILGAIFIFMTYFSVFTYSEFVESLTYLRLPSFFVGSFIIMLHYIPIIAQSNSKILEAQELRGKKITSYWQRLKTHAFIMGKRFLTNIENSEKIYESLKMRGFNGKLNYVRTKIQLHDIALLAILTILVSLTVIFIDISSIYREVFSSIYREVFSLFLP